MREAAQRTLPREWSAYLEYAVAAAACTAGDAAAMRRATAALEAFAAANPELSSYALPRAMLLADLQRALGNHRAALTIIEALRKDAEVAADPVWGSQVLGLRSEVLRETGRIDEAAASANESLALAHRSGDQEAVTRALVRQQAMALVTGRFAEARATIDRLLAAQPGDSDSRALLLVFKGLAEAGAADQDPAMLAMARTTLDEGRAIATGHLRVRADLKRLDLALRSDDVPGATRSLADCEQNLGPLPAGRGLTRDEAEFVGLATRLLLLRDAGPDELRTWRPVQQRAHDAIVAEWRQHDPARGGIGLLHLSDRRELLSAGIELELRLASHEGRADGPARALQILLDLQAATSLARHRGAAPCTVATVQRQLLQEDHAALVFLPTRRRSWVFLVDETSVALWELQGNRALARTCGIVAGLLARPPTVRGEPRELLATALHAALREASELLLPASLRTRLPTCGHLTVVGADLLEGLPFETLLLEDGRLLGEVVPITNTASLPLVTALATRTTASPPAAARVVVFGCTQPAAGPATAGIETFEFPLAELQPGLDRYAHPPTVYGDTQVTRDRVLSTRFVDHDIVHFIVHHVRGSDPGLGGVLVVRDGVLAASDFAGRALRGLVIVSACGSGRGPVRSGEGEAFASLAGGFLWNGADTVVASCTELLALDHLRLMRRMHTHLAAGESPARALQIARAAMAAGSDRLARAHRAAVQVFGAGQVPVSR